MPEVTWLLSSGTRTETILLTIVLLEFQGGSEHTHLGDDARRVLEEVDLTEESGRATSLGEEGHQREEEQ